MIKKYRKMRNYTQEELAELIDITPRQLQRIENQESNPKISTLKKIITILNIKDEDIAFLIKNELIDEK